MPAKPSGLHLRDAAVAVALAYLAAHAALDPPGPAFTGPAWAAWLAGAAVGLPLAVRGRWPVPVLAWVVAAAAVATALGVVGFGAISATYAPVAVALYTVATASSRIAAGAGLVAGLVVPAVAIPWLYDRSSILAADASASEVPLWWQVELGVVVVVTTAAWAVGWTVRWRRSVRAETDRRLTGDAVAAERLRIARELHDIVGHSMSVILVKSTVANHIADERPAEARDALVTIERTSRAALVEIRRLLGVLRPGTTADAGADTRPPAAFAPAPGPADLPDLADRLRSPGLRVEVRTDGVDDLPEAVGLTVYRIVQEALTNVVKHADAGCCRVTVRAAEGGVRIEVVDDGRAPRSSARRPAGQGLIGMQERVAVYGGTLSAGPRPEGGFRVVADVPYAVAEHPA
ncbi:sensor histidine kinase [Pseudonocardia lacus]|uniref:sensor histidine kinase n=1 Tax=Pseudonocardia lacus TaxID=2835865 RepID=UPI001BDCC6D1|nr:sensor histidine kinase [Pseudonocardia lacus]